MQIGDVIRASIRERGPLTVAAFMDLALYHPALGYYARAAQRSGRAGDFFTSVDVGALFGELLARQIAEMADIVVSGRRAGDSELATVGWDFIEAGAGNGRLAADILGAMRRDAPALYAQANVHLVEASPVARAAQREMLGPSAQRLRSSSALLPEQFEGVLLANELLDAMPAHVVVMRESGLHEVYVDMEGRELVAREGPLSASRLSEHLKATGAELEPGCRAEISLAAIDWIRRAARRLTRGFMIVIDYGHQAHELYSVTHSAGTLTSYSRHSSAGSESTSPHWLQAPGDQDITAHVDFTSVQCAADSEGCSTLGFVDQMYFLMALAADRLATMDLKERLAFKTLILPGGLGSTMKVLVVGKQVGGGRLTGCASGGRIT